MRTRLALMACLLAVPGPTARAVEASGRVSADRSQEYSYAGFTLRDTVLALPPTERALLRDALCKSAESELDSRNRQAAASDLFVVVTDVPGRGAAQRLLAHLDATRERIASSLGTAGIFRLREEPVHVYVLARADAYQRLLSRAQQLSWSAGFYHPSGFIALNGQWPSHDFLYGYLMHEATHALIDRMVRKTGVEMPRWLEEGFADYIGHADLVRGELRPGRHRERWAGRAFAPKIGEFVLIPSAARLDAAQVKRIVRSGKRLSLRDLFELDSQSFYGADRRRYYTQSWMTVEFLHHGRADWDTTAFPQFFRAVASGAPIREAFVSTYGSAPEDLDEAFRQFALRF